MTTICLSLPRVAGRLVASDKRTRSLLMAARFRRIVCLSNVHDDNYTSIRGEQVVPCLSASKRRDLFASVQAAAGTDLIIVSSPPKATARRQGKWLSAVQTHFSYHLQFFAPNWDIPKLRIPCSWIFYAVEALKRTGRGDLVILDNYELIYVIAAYLLKWFKRPVFLLDYEDGKHLIDRGWARLLSSTAECWGRRLISGAFVAHPALSSRLPESIPSVLVPGFVVPLTRCSPCPTPDAGVRFLYSGSLDEPRGIDLILDALPMLPKNRWTLDITGRGPLEHRVTEAARDPRWPNRVRFHGRLSHAAFSTLAQSCHIGLNCQRPSDPISAVTFPSKIFTYLSAGLFVISSRASEVPDICGRACRYYDKDAAPSLAALMIAATQDFYSFRSSFDVADVNARYSLESTAERLRKLITVIWHGDV